MTPDNSPQENRPSTAPDSDQRYRSMLAAMAEGVVFQDSGGRIVFCNPSAERILGLPAEQMAGRTSSDPFWQPVREDGSVFPGEEHPAMVTLRTGRPCRDVMMGLTRPDGTVTWISVNSEPLQRSEEALPYAVVTTFSDVTRQRRSELILKQSEALYRSLVENQGEGIGIMDLEERFLFANPTGEIIFGVLPGTLPGRSLFEFISAEAAELIRAQTRDRVSGRSSEYELDIIRESDGAIRTLLISATPQIDDAGKVSASFGVFRDITERKRVETALQESEERLRLAVEANRLGTFDIYPQSGKRVWSAVTKQFFGFPADAEVSFEDFIGAIHADDRERVRAGVKAMLSPEQGAISVSEFRTAKLVDGQPRWLVSWGRTFFDEQGRPVRLIGITQDITERKRAEEEREKLQVQLLHAQKMESIGRLAGGVAHDFNNLLTVINGYSSMALRRLDPQDPLREIIREVHGAGEAAAILVQQLLAFGRKQLLRKEPVELNCLISGLEKTLLPLLGEHIEIRTVLRPSLSQVVTDPHQVKQVIINLAVNARDAMPRGGILTIETDEVTCGPYCRRCISPMGAGRYVCMTVRDNGSGIDEQTRQHLFEPFFSTKAAGHGTGLGLAMVHGIVLQSGGHIDVESRPGEGTSFYVYLPATEQTGISTGGSATAVAPETRARGNETILLVEDQPEVRRLTANLLQECGYGVVEAASAEEALSQISSKRVDLILTDVVLPKMSGCELAAEIQSRQPGTKVLFMSGYSDEILKGQAGGIGDAQLIQKPFAPAEMAEKLRQLLGGGASD